MNKWNVLDEVKKVVNSSRKKRWVVPLIIGIAVVGVIVGVGWLLVKLFKAFLPRPRQDLANIYLPRVRR